jgi:hypothetical protein
MTPDVRRVCCVSVGGYVSGRPGSCCRGRTWRWIEAHALQFEDWQEGAFVARLAAALGEICVSDAQGRSGADISIFDISLTPADLAWLEDDPLRRLRLLAPDPGDRIRAPRCSGDAFPWQRANVVAVDADQPLSALIGGDAQGRSGADVKVVTMKVTILPEDHRQAPV